MGYSSVKVSLTYQRGIEVPELNEGDMPELKYKTHKTSSLFTSYKLRNWQNFFLLNLNLYPKHVFFTTLRINI